MGWQRAPLWSDLTPSCARCDPSGAWAPFSWAEGSRCGGSRAGGCPTWLLSMRQGAPDVLQLDQVRAREPRQPDACTWLQGTNGGVRSEGRGAPGSAGFAKVLSTALSALSKLQLPVAPQTLKGSCTRIRFTILQPSVLNLEPRTLKSQALKRYYTRNPDGVPWHRSTCVLSAWCGPCC